MGAAGLLQRHSGHHAPQLFDGNVHQGLAQNMFEGMSMRDAQGLFCERPLANVIWDEDDLHDPDPHGIFSLPVLPDGTTLLILDIMPLQIEMTMKPEQMEFGGLVVRDDELQRVNTSRWFVDAASWLCGLCG